MTGIAGWFFAYLFFMAVELFFRSLISLWFCAGALGAWIGALMGRTAEEQLFVFLIHILQGFIKHTEQAF